MMCTWMIIIKFNFLIRFLIFSKTLLETKFYISISVRLFHRDEHGYLFNNWDMINIYNNSFLYYIKRN
jgi:hypothetical protein